MKQVKVMEQINVTNISTGPFYQLSHLQNNPPVLARGSAISQWYQHASSWDCNSLLSQVETKIKGNIINS